MKPVGEGNRYGLPPFYQRHAWIWAPNPLGTFEDWNSRVTCRGQGDPAWAATHPAAPYCSLETPSHLQGAAMFKDTGA